MERFIRTCQSCGHKQQDTPPSPNQDPSPAYLNRRCKRCRSPDLDYGSWHDDDNDPHKSNDDE